MKRDDQQRGQAETVKLGNMVPAKGPLESISELAGLLDQYMADLQAGKKPDRARLVAEHAHLAPHLEEALAGLEFIHGAGAQQAGPPAQLGDFRIVREVGRGGMGVVYEAEQISLKRRVALKVLRFGGAADEVAMQRFQREAETVATLHHTNIVPIHAIGSEQGVRYYAMQFIEGRNLAEFSAQGTEGGQPITPQQVADWGLQAAEALAHAHRRGVIHRDIKPSNLILDPAGRIWLTDFGLARRLEDATLSLAGALLGTPRYMSPEQASAATRPVDHRTDIYSLGATLYELATRRPIFDAQSPHEVLNRIIHDEPVPPRRVMPTLPRDLETIILKCLAKHPAQRYATAQALADDLRAFLEGRSIRARRSSLPVQALRWARKHRRSTTVAGYSTLASALALAGLFFGVRFYRQSQLAQLTLTTSEPLLQAEILDPHRNDAVRPAFSLPNRQPVPLPAGSYRVRLSAPGRLSETHQLDLERRSANALAVALENRALGTPLKIEMSDTAELVDLNGSADVVVARMWEMWRVDAASGTNVWRVSLRPSDHKERLRTEQERTAWNLFFQRPMSGGAQLLRPAPDLDGDGVRDLVWSSLSTPALLAVSGKTGQVLWWYAGYAPEDAAPAHPSETMLLHSGLVEGAPVAIELDGDGIPDVVALFASQSRRWIAAVSGKTGEAIWRRSLEAGWAWTNREEHSAPKIGQVDGQPVVVVPVGTRLVLLEARRGEVLLSHDLHATAIQEPRIADLDGDDRDEVVLLAERAEQTRMLIAWSLAKRQQLWQNPVAARFEPHAAFPEQLDWPVVTDLDHDGKSEIILPARSPYPPSMQYADESHWVGLEVFNGADGSLRWRRELAHGNTPHAMQQLDRLIPGPDLDQDGVDEIFTAMLYSRSFRPGDTTLFVDALSGRDGAPLWSWRKSRLDLNDKIGSLAWWPANADSWPQLTVQTVRWPRRPDALHVLAAGSGEPAEMIPSAFGAQAADCDGDSLPDLCFRWSDQPDAEYAASLRLLKGTPPKAWSRLCNASRTRLVVPDLDGDGWEDVVLASPLEAYSAATGAPLWHYRGGCTRVVPLAASAGDLDGDGLPDLLAVQSHTSGVNMWTFQPVTAVSAKTGRALWNAGLKTRGAGELGLAACQDLDRDGQAEIVLAMAMEAENVGLQASVVSPPSISNQLWLVVLSSRDGTLKWRQPLSEPFSLGPSGWQDPAALADLNGDGAQEIVIGALSPDGTWELRAYQGTDGRPLWTRPVSGFAREAGLFSPFRSAPMPVAGDLDGDGVAEVALVDYARLTKPGPDGAGFECTLLVLEGRTGQPKWTWTWSEQSDQYRVVPQFVNLHGGAQRHLCLQTGRLQAAELLLFDAAGAIRERRPVKLRSYPAQIRHADLDGDHREELLFVSNDGRLHVSRNGLGEVVWQAPADAVQDILPAVARQPVTVVVERNGRLHGLSGVTGQPLWRYEEGLHRSRPVTLLRHRELPMPRGLTAGPVRPEATTEQPGSLICRPVLPTLPDGTYAPKTLRPLALPALDPDPRLARSLPWNFTGFGFAPRSAGWLRSFGFRTFLGGTVLALFLCVPALLVRWIWRRWSWKQGLAALVVMVGLIGWALVATQPAGMPLSWLVHMLLPALYALPQVWFLSSFAKALAGRRWVQAALLAAAAVILSVVAAGLWLAADRQAKPAEEYYSAEGWYWALLLGGYLVGLGILALSAYRAGQNGIRRLLRRRLAAAAN